MDCNHVQQTLSAWIDRQIPAEEAERLEQHLATCADCRAVEAAMRAQDAALVQAFEPGRRVAQQLSAKVLEAWRAESVSPDVIHPVTFSQVRRWPSHAAAAAIGFLAATLLFQPWKAWRAAEREMPVAVTIAQEPMVATLVASNGPVQAKLPGKTDFCSVDLSAFKCPALTEVKTGQYGCAELETSSGSVIRLDQDTQVKITSDKTLEIDRGQIWCSSPQDTAVHVTAASQAEGSPQPVGLEWQMRCDPGSKLLTTTNPGMLQVTAAEGEVNIQTPQGKACLTRGEHAAIVGNEIRKSSSPTDPILAASWMRPLLVSKGYENQELHDHVNQLLAHRGQSKLTHLYEQEIRSLGEYSVLPLLRYIELPISQGDDKSQRRLAMQIVSDLAPQWTIADFIQLLSDDDPEIRVLSARTLQRLTGLDQGRLPEKWREDAESCQPDIQNWNRWQQKNQHQFAKPILKRALL